MRNLLPWKIMPGSYPRSMVILVIACFLCLAVPTGHVPAFAASTSKTLQQQVQSMLDQVDQAKIKKYTADLSGENEVLIGGQPYTIESRHALDIGALKAGQFLYEFYAGLGLQVEYDHFSFSKQTLSNIVAQKDGSIFPERIFIISAHYDDVPITDRAPGADDNASGTTGVMMAAEILDQYDFGCTLRFVNFGAEEYGMIGSKSYAHQAYCAGEEIQGVINLDMIAWNTLGSTTGMDIHSSPSIPGSDDLANAFQDVVRDYNLDLAPELADPVTTRSDHSSFWKYNYPAILVSEAADDFNPNYHTEYDDLDSLQDLNYYTNMVKASLGTLASVGCLVENGWGIISGQVTDSQSLDPVPGASIELHNPEWGYTWITKSDENGNYQFSALSGWHKLIVDRLGYARQSSDVLILQDDTQVENIEIEAVHELTVFFPFSANVANSLPPGCP